MKPPSPTLVCLAHEGDQNSAPTVTLERIPSGTESIDATDALLSCHPGVKMDAQIAVCNVT